MKIAGLRVERRLGTSRLSAVATPLVAAALGLALSGVILAIAGQSPLGTYRDVFDNSLNGAGQISATLVSATPLVLTGLAAAIAFRARVWNIGGEGQLYVGAITGAAAGIVLGGRTGWVAVPAMLVAGSLGGAAWASIPAVLRTRFRTNEILTSLMLNYVAGLLLAYLIFDSSSYWRDTTSPGAKVFPQGKSLDPSVHWPGFVQGDLVMPLGFAVGAILGVGLLVYNQRTRPVFAG